MDAEVLVLDPAGEFALESLRSAGASVDEVSDLGSARDALSTRAPDCLVVVDRPDLDAVRAARDVGDGVPVVVAAHGGSERLAARAVNAGVDRYVSDDVGGDAARAVADLLDASRPGRPPEVATYRSDGGTASDRTTVPEGVEVPEEVPFELKERAMDEAPVGITISDPDLEDNPLIYINDAFERMTGYDKQRVLGTNCRFLQGDETDSEAVARIREALEVDEPVSVELVNYRKDGEKFWNQLQIAPIRNDAGEVTNYVGFQMDVTQRKRAEFAAERYAEELDRERAALDRILDRVNGLVQEAAEALVRASTRGAVEREVCDLVGGTDPYVGAWIGELDLASEAVEVTATANLSTDLISERIPLDGGDGPVLAAVESGELHTADVANLGPIHQQASGDARAVAAIPLAYRDTRYGVLAVYAADDDAMDERERSVLGALGRMVATGINAIETKEILTADDVVALEFELRDRDLFFVDLSARLGCSLEHAGSVWRDEGSLLAFFSVDGADGESVLAAAADAPGIDDASVITETEEGCLVEFVVEAPSILTELADRGARVQTIAATDGGARLQVEVPHESTARSVVSLVTDEYDAELVAYRELERPPTTKGEFLTELRDRLTERQLTALQKSYVSGYYDWPRRTDGDAIAESMGISRSTFHQHLRAAQRKLVSELFADPAPTS